MKKFIFWGLLTIVMAGCSLPDTTVRSIDSRPSLAIKGVSSTAKLVIDGLDMGRADTYNGDTKVLMLEPGTHKVTVLDGGTVLYEQLIFVESELKSITLK